MAIVVIEGCLLGALGGALGVLLGFAVAGAINAGGGLLYSAGDQAFSILVKPGISSIWVNVAPATLVAGLASILPGLHALRRSPAECLRQA